MFEDSSWATKLEKKACFDRLAFHWLDFLDFRIRWPVFKHNSSTMQLLRKLSRPRAITVLHATKVGRQVAPKPIPNPKSSNTDDERRETALASSSVKREVLLPPVSSSYTTGKTLASESGVKPKNEHPSPTSIQRLEYR
jgi:hypothetical protein